jgi:hypothetical protein
MKINTRLLRRIQKHILTIPKKLFDMDNWSEVVFNRGKECGTAHCIGGWACALKGSKYFGHADAKALLGLDDEQATRLFMGDSWPRGFGGWKATPQQAVARIDKFIESKGAI